MAATLTLALLSIVSSYGYKVEKYGIVLPNVSPNMQELYVCSSLRLNSTANYIVGFEPNASMEKVHHMVLYGCLKPGNVNPLWNCGEMGSEIVKKELETSTPCAPGSYEVLYAWARDAANLELPPDVGFKVGGLTDVQYFVLQVHFAAAHNHKERDHHEIAPKSVFDGSSGHSGLHIRYTLQPMGKLAALFLLAANGEIPPMSEEHWESACMIRENKTIHPFAFRTHAHLIGTVVSGYVVKVDRNAQHHWTLIGKKNPQLPHMFYPVVNNVTVSEGDILAARCTYVSDRKNVTYAGMTINDEMCNFYVMYYVEEGEPLKMKYCFTRGAPFYYWKSELNNIPNDASTPEESASGSK